MLAAGNIFAGRMLMNSTAFCSPDVEDAAIPKLNRALDEIKLVDGEYIDDRAEYNGLSHQQGRFSER